MESTRTARAMVFIDPVNPDKSNLQFWRIVCKEGEREGFAKNKAEAKAAVAEALRDLETQN